MRDLTLRRAKGWGAGCRGGWFAVAVGALLLASSPGGLLNADGPREDVTKAEVVRILMRGSEADLLGPGADVIETYDGFVLARLSPDVQRILRDRGLVIVPQDLFTLRVNGITFDTRLGLHLPPELTTETGPGDHGYFLIQFAGPIKQEWRERVEDLGLDVEGYVANNAYLVRSPPSRMKTVENLPFVQWTGDHHPAFRISPSLLAARGPIEVKLVTFGGEPLEPLFETLHGMGLREVPRTAAGPGIVDSGAYKGFGLVRVRLDASQLLPLARLNGVRYIEPFVVARPMVASEQYVLQTNASTEGPGARRLWDLGLRGEGQAIAFADTGLDYDHAMFRESAGQVVLDNGDIYNVTDYARRKVVRYLTMSQYVGIDPWTDKQATRDSPVPNCFTTFGHGTSTAGTAAGDDTAIGTSPNDGMAPAAKIIEMDIGNVTGVPPWCGDALSFLPNDWSLMFGAGYSNGARIFSNSWGLATSNYTLESRMVDEFVWQHPDALILFAAGNNPPSVPVISPASAKNNAGVSAASSTSLTGREDITWTSQGPTPDGRWKPDVVTFWTTLTGEGTPRSDGDLRTMNGDEIAFTGTSYAAPLAAGMGALARQYFQEGWYPTGSKGGTPIDPSAALLKALMMASSEQMVGYRSCPSTDPYYPNGAQGWGRLWLDQGLHFENDTRKLFVVDEPAALTTGATASYNVRVNSPGESLRVMLAWSDYPGLEGANPALVNDLDLLVTDPNGVTYKGNVRSPCADGETGAGGSFDLLNNVEGVARRSPPTGVWKVEVIGSGVPMGPQGFGLVVLGDVESSGPTPNAPTEVTAGLSGTSSESVRIRWQIPAGPPIDKFQVYAGTSFDADRGGYVLLADELPATSSSWDHVGAGNGDATSRFYAVRAVNADGGTFGRQQAAKFTRPLGAGWNLVSIPVTPEATDLESVLGTFQWQTVRTFLAGSSDPWRSWDRTTGTGDLAVVSTGMALWVDVAIPGDFTIAGQVPWETTVSIEPGWNLLGYASFIARTPDVTFPTSLGVSRVERFDDTPPYYLTRMAPTDDLGASHGYWVFATNAGPWTVTN